MIVEAQITVSASKAATWAKLADIEHSASFISGIEAIEIVHKPAQGLVGLRWKETRMLFGKPESVEKWITEAAEGEFYKTRAEHPGFVFLSTLRLAEGPGGVTLTSAHETLPQDWVAKLKSIPMVLFFKGVIRKALMADLNDLKAAAEGR
ncbi:SRPBCC family protein [Pelomonas sp. SE-A7]|uniref:SRPBCC family protein n=1 Tax=Pelomonas sp. SE-A7 TaxID=3054953 RepID=UPI00259D0E26|nr:SRPBCC family protein [Pelomonas sp. SE-A7]MDM4766608.1 SRPBCC family protein [Pelomonas sp. SE-A7]